ncbi:MAG: hypothetical protein ACK56I_29270, partial [bacterium]
CSGQHFDEGKVFSEHRELNQRHLEDDTKVFTFFDFVDARPDNIGHVFDFRLFAMTRWFE